MVSKLFSAPCLCGISAVEYTFLNSGAIKRAMKTGELCEEEEAWICGLCPEGPEGYGHC
jgi:hypothetical protein